LRRAAGALLIAVSMAAAHAADPIREAAPASADPALEARVMRLSAELRCLVCQNQTIADSNADLAVDLRNQVREMLRDGRSDEDVLAYMTERYGDFVLYRPPLRAATFVLWFGPALLLVIGAGVLVTILRRRNRLAADRFEPDEDDEPTPILPGTPPGAPR
jgi:cytochrome c-type biogenesis protein CcmH